MRWRLWCRSGCRPGPLTVLGGSGTGVCRCWLFGTWYRQPLACSRSGGAPRMAQRSVSLLPRVGGRGTLMLALPPEGIGGISPDQHHRRGVSNHPVRKIALCAQAKGIRRCLFWSNTSMHKSPGKIGRGSMDGMDATRTTLKP